MFIVDWFRKLFKEPEKVPFSPLLRRLLDDEQGREYVDRLVTKGIPFTCEIDGKVYRVSIY